MSADALALSFLLGTLSMLHFGYPPCFFMLPDPPKSWSGCPESPRGQRENLQAPGYYLEWSCPAGVSYITRPTCHSEVTNHEHVH